MIKRLSVILVLLGAALLSGSCVKEQAGSKPESGSGEIDCIIPFGSPKGASIDVGTRAQLGIVRESNVFNLYLLIFEGNQASSKKIYGRYFDGSNLNAIGESNYWTVTNMSDESDAATHGTLHIRTSKRNGCTIVAVANMNPNDLDVSAGQLSSIQNFGQLQNVVATQVRSEVAANSGFFLMTGQVDGVDIQGNGTDESVILDSSNPLRLRRLYAKVTFNVSAAADPSTHISALKKFQPYDWKVVNVPTCAYLLERSGADAANSADKVFSTEAVGFETETLDPVNKYNDDVTKISIYSFSFYMMENRHEPAPGCDSYDKREKQEKPASYTQGDFFDNGGFVYADPLSTYVVIKGKLVMGVSSNGNDNATLDADVQYKIHLGNFSSSASDFNTERNHNYVYNIHIGGAEKIKAEVEAFDDSTNPLYEPEPGASGRVVVALEEIFNSDCHYSTQVISFHAKYMNPENISWYVETPFNEDGVGGADVDSGRATMADIDYKWVEFLVNDTDAQGTYYSDKRAIYRPHEWDGFREINGDPIPYGDKRRTMYVNELVDYLKRQKSQYDIDVRKNDPSDPEYDPDWGWKNDFDNDPGTHGPKISVTAFISEYYYTSNPLTQQYDPTLWKTVVNHPMRRMHILASSTTSADKESNVIGSSFTIQQRSIQSVYAVHEVAGLQSAWGMEFSDDEKETGASTFWRNQDMEDCGNTSSTNGRINSLKLWGVLNPDGTPNMVGERWDKYLNLTGNNETAHLWSNYNYLRYSCLSRNRDNNGNEIIDADEIRWYMASDVQLIGVFLGAYGIEGDSRLYQRSAVDQGSSTNETWRQHIISSNRYIYNSNPPADAANSNKYPRVIWAEEGVNGSNMAYTGNDKTVKFSTRCVRNLGYYLEGGRRQDITLAADPEVEPDPYLTVTRKRLNEDGSVTSPYTGAYDDHTFFVFDCSRINRESLRDPVDHELIGHDEHSKMACLSSGFETAPTFTITSSGHLSGNYSFNNKTYNLQQIQALNSYLDDSFPNLDVNLPVCPSGYRVPNVREMAVMWNMITPMTTGDAIFLGQDDNKAVSCRTHWSFGIEGKNKVAGRWGWAMSQGHLLMAAYNRTCPTVRCVKDIE